VVTVAYLQRAVMLVPHLAGSQNQVRGHVIPFPHWGRETEGREQSWGEERKREVPTWGMDRTTISGSSAKGYCPSAAHHHCHCSTPVPRCTPSLYVPSPYCRPMATAFSQPIAQPHPSHSCLLRGTFTLGYLCVKLVHKPMSKLQL